MPALALPYPKHLGAACRAHTLSCWLTILHGNALSILHLSFGAALHTICLHRSTSIFVRSIVHSSLECQYFPQIAQSSVLFNGRSALNLQLPKTEKCCLTSDCAIKIAGQNSLVSYVFIAQIRVGPYHSEDFAI
jgi:hypothetical protein